MDPDMWEKIVLNLLPNALKFTMKGRISVEFYQPDHMVELRVSDTGTGIAPDQLGKVFERFHRVEGAAGRTHEGTGIGLASCMNFRGCIKVQPQLKANLELVRSLSCAYPTWTRHVSPKQISSGPSAVRSSFT